MMNERIELSIIIPHFNSIKTLERLLISILKQCDDRVEVIVVDDNSTKEIELFKIIKNRYYKKVLFLENITKKNSAGTCRNIGIKNAKGKWLLFCDSDDYLIKGWYTKVSRFFESKKDVIFFIPKSIDEKTGNSCGREKEYVKLAKNYINNRYASDIRLRYNWGSPCSKMIKSEFIKANNIAFDNIMYFNDLLFSTKVGLYMTGFDVYTDSIYCITKGNNNLTSNRSEEAFWIKLEATLSKYVFLKNEIYEKRQWLLSGCILDPLIMLCKALKRGYSLAYINKIIKLYKLNNIHIITKDVLVYLLYYYPCINLKYNRDRNI